MNGLLLVIVIAILVAIAIIQIFLLLRKVPVDLNPVRQAIQSVELSYERTERSVREEIAKNREETAKALQQSREELTGSLKGVGDTLFQQFGVLTQTTDKKLDMLKAAVEQRLHAIQADNAKQLDQMRATVDEKLQGTLEKRLGESFKQVSERLEQVYKGLGEMQSLATGVGDLKKVLTNVKTRGTWGEVQLGAMLEQVLTPDRLRFGHSSTACKWVSGRWRFRNDPAKSGICCRRSRRSGRNTEMF